MSTELIKAEPRSVLLSPVMNLQTANSRLEQFQQFVAGYLQESKDGGTDGGDYGVIPGAGQKKVLLKSGADKLAEIYGIYDEYEIESHENFETNLFFYRVKCILKSRADDSTVGTGLGSCSTYESKYRYRDAQRKCPKCGSSAIIKGKEQFGGGWLCWGKKGGCGAKFADNDKAIADQRLDRVENPDILDTVNTVLKMAKKRAKIDAVIGVTRSSGLFTQDLEDVELPPKVPPAPVTSEPIPIRPSAGGSVKGDAVEPSKTATAAPPAETREPGDDDEAEAIADAISGTTTYIDQGMKANFSKAFKEALPKGKFDAKRTEELRKEWLGAQGYSDEKGTPTSGRITKAGFAAARDKACKWASAQ